MDLRLATLKQSLSICCTMFQHWINAERFPLSHLCVNILPASRPLRFAAHRQPLCWNFMYHSRIVLSVGGSVRYMVRNLRCTVTIDSVLANSKTQNDFLFTVHAIFRHDYPLTVEPASTQRHLVQKNFARFSTYWYAPFCRVCLGCCAVKFGSSGGTYE